MSNGPITYAELAAKAEELTLAAIPALRFYPEHVYTDDRAEITSLFREVDAVPEVQRANPIHVAICTRRTFGNPRRKGSWIHEDNVLEWLLYLEGLSIGRGTQLQAEVDALRHELDNRARFDGVVDVQGQLVLEDFFPVRWAGSTLCQHARCTLRLTTAYVGARP